jgi:hypothetical protein
MDTFKILDLIKGLQGRYQKRITRYRIQAKEPQATLADSINKGARASATNACLDDLKNLERVIISQRNYFTKPSGEL